MRLEWSWNEDASTDALDPEAEEDATSTRRETLKPHIAAHVRRFQRQLGSCGIPASEKARRWKAGIAYSSVLIVEVMDMARTAKRKAPGSEILVRHDVDFCTSKASKLST